jgi:hypothetical protein
MHGSNIMWKFFAKASVFLIGIGFLFHVSGTLADRVAPLEDWRIEHQQRVESLRARQDVIEAVTLGNSHSDSLDYSILGIEGQSLAFAAADLFEIEQYARYLDDKLPNLKTVFIAVSYYSFSWDNAAFEPYRRRRIRYYSMVPAWSPIRGDMPDFILGKLESLTHVMSEVRSDNWFGIWVGLAGNVPAANTADYDGVLTESAWGLCPHYTAEQLEIHAPRTAKRNVSDSSRMASVHPQLEQEAYNALARTIEGLQSNRIRVVLFTPTYYEEYNKYFMEDGSGIVEDMREMIDRLHQTYQVEYYDFSSHREIENQPDLFYNSDHLGKCGKKVFSAKLLQAMNYNIQK